MPGISRRWRRRGGGKTHRRMGAAERLLVRWGGEGARVELNEGRAGGDLVAWFDEDLFDESGERDPDGDVFGFGFDEADGGDAVGDG